MAKSKSKYASVLPRLEHEEIILDAYQEKVEAEKDVITDYGTVTHTPESLGRLYRQAREGAGPPATGQEIATLVERFGVEGLEQLRYLAQIRVTALEQMLSRSYELEEPGWGLYGAQDNAVRLPSGHSISITPEINVKVENPDAFREWCIKNGLGHKLQLWPSTTAAITKERLVAGAKPPTGVVAKQRPKINFRRPGKDKDDE